MAGTRFPGGIATGVGAVEVAGIPASGTLRIAANVADGENVVVGSTTFKFVQLNTEHDATTLGLNNTQEENHNVLIAAHGLDRTDLIRVENEIMEVLGVPDVNHVHLRRGVSGSTIASHANETAIYTQATPAGPGSVKVGLGATLTPTVATTALVADMNNRARSREAIKAVRVDANTVFVYTTDKPGGNPSSISSALPTTETMAGSGNAWDAVTLTGGKPPFSAVTISGVPTANQVTAGKIIVATPFDSPVVHSIKFYATATFAPLAWDGEVTVSGNLLILDNTGEADWDANDTYEILVAED